MAELPRLQPECIGTWIEWPELYRDSLAAFLLDRFPHAPALAESAQGVTQACWESPAMVHFVEPANPNQVGSPWQFAHNCTVECPVNGSLILDILTESRLGGIEFLDRL